MIINNRKPLYVHVAVEMHGRLKVLAAERGVTMTALLEEALGELLEKHAT